VQKHFALPREFSDGADFIAIVNRAELGCLGDADHARLMRMYVGLTRDHRFHFVDVDLASVTANKEQL